MLEFSLLLLFIVLLKKSR